jgi:hypothetical protein
MGLTQFWSVVGEKMKIFLNIGELALFSASKGFWHRRCNFSSVTIGCVVVVGGSC